MAIGTGWHLPDPPLRASVTRTLTIGAAGVVLAASLAGNELQLSSTYPLKAVVLFGVVLALALGHVSHSHPFRRFGPANQITSLRTAIVSLVAALLGEDISPEVAFLVVAAGVIVTALDGLDGRAARRTGMDSAFGARFDMEVDALFILALSALTWTTRKAGVWILLAGLLRYLFVAAMRPLPWMRRELPQSLRGKGVCVVQVVGLSVVMLPALTPPLSAWLCAALLLTLCYSFTVDTWWLWRRRG